MPTQKMHKNEIETSPELVYRLLSAQFSHWADLPITRVQSAGTDNALYRLGDELVVRLPRIEWAIGQVHKEHEWLPKLAPHLPLSLPVQLEIGQPDGGYPWHWAIYQWLPGKNVTMDEIVGPCEAAAKLAQFLLALQQLDTTGGPPAIEANVRGASLKLRDEETRRGIAALEDMIDTEIALALWEDALDAPEWEREPVWLHGDLLPGNLLFTEGRLSAVIDFSGLAVGDPACDLMIAWGLFAGESREVLRRELGVDDATWARGRGHSLSQAVIFIPYYLDTNPVGIANARHMLDSVLSDYGRMSL